MGLGSKGTKLFISWEQGIMLEYFMEQGSSLLVMGTFWEDFKEQFNLFIGKRGQSKAKRNLYIPERPQKYPLLCL